MRYADMSFGLNGNALAVAQILADRETDGPEGQMIHFRTFPWYNGREKGVLFQCREYGPKRRDVSLFIAVFEHRNSDNICALKWEDNAPCINPPNIDDGRTAKLAYPTDSKWDVAHSVKYNEAGLMAEWVREQFDGWIAKGETIEIAPQGEKR